MWEKVSRRIQKQPMLHGLDLCRDKTFDLGRHSQAHGPCSTNPIFAHVLLMLPVDCTAVK